MNENDIVSFNIALYSINLMLVIGFVFLKLWEMSIAWLGFLCFIYSFVIILLLNTIREKINRI